MNENRSSDDDAVRLRVCRAPEEQTWAKVVQRVAIVMPNGNPWVPSGRHGVTLPPLKPGYVFVVSVARDYSHGFGIATATPLHRCVDVEELARRVATVDVRV